MPSQTPEKSQDGITPRQYLEFIKLGTGVDLDHSAYREYIGANGELARKTRDSIEGLMSMKAEALRAIAKTERGARKRAKAEIRQRMMANLPFLAKYKDGEKEAGLREAAVMANDYINDVTDYYFPGVEEVKMNNEVEMCNDPAELALRACDDRLAKKVKYEAARKLLLMKFLGEIKDYSEEQVDNEEALNDMMNFFNSRILRVPEGNRVGDVFPMYMVSRHDVEDFRATSAKFVTEKPKYVDVNDMTQVTYLPSRRTILPADERFGDEREIHFSMEPRSKTVQSRLTKALRYGTEIGKKDVDRNGIRLAFANQEDWEAFSAMFESELQNEIRSNLEERLNTEINEKERVRIKRRINNIEKSVVFRDVKDSLDGSDFDGNTKTSSHLLKVVKFKLVITRADDRVHRYEFQVFLPDGYADTIYRKGVSWEEYNINRFFDEEVDELLFPSAIYTEIDRGKARQKVMRHAHKNVWNGNSLD